MRCVVLFVALTVMATFLSGCETTYVLRGRVIEGMPPGIHAMPAAQLAGEAPPVARATVNIYRDPNRLNKSLVANGLTGPDGSFAIPIHAFGAGWMDEMWLVEVLHGQYQGAETILMLPPDTKRTQLLIMLAPGRGVSPAASPHSENLLEESRRYW
ncbi:MAG TPA: hypothetical protein PK400_13025 [Phycisphaerales bacterium]|nr:hypothetical protein [Phycisphaerales bacterium]